MKKLPLKIRLVDFTRQLYHRFDEILVRFTGSSRTGSSVYHLLFSRAYADEQFAVLRGRRKFVSQRVPVVRLKESSALLRRNIHRLEKGLIMKPRRSVFARDYIQETVEEFLTILGDEKADPTVELLWAENVLNEYFSVIECEDEPLIYCHRLFEKRPKILFNDKHRKPYFPDPSFQPNVSYEDLYQLALKRRSVRWYKNMPVPREIVDRAVAIAAQAPSACNRQAFRFLVFDEAADATRIGAIPIGTSGFHQNFQGLIAVIGDLSAYSNPRDRHVIYIDSSLAVMALMFSFETDSVSSCSINWPDLPKLEKRLRNEVMLEDYERVIMMISFGYAELDGLIPFSQKKTIDELRQFYRER